MPSKDGWILWIKVGLLRSQSIQESLLFVWRALREAELYPVIGNI
jgi:hypothetical protein